MIAVDPAHQGAGVGTSLMQQAVTEIRAQGVDLAVIATGGDPGHAPARALYEKLDFNPSARSGTTAGCNWRGQTRSVSARSRGLVSPDQALSLDRHASRHPWAPGAASFGRAFATASA